MNKSNGGAISDGQVDADMNHRMQGSSSNNVSNEFFEGLEDLSLTDGDERNDVEEDDISTCEVGDIDFQTLTPSDVKKLMFSNPDAAYEFYNEYGKLNGFGVRKHKNIRNKEGKMISYSYVCCREGFRRSEYLNLPNRKREHRVLTRCGCTAEMRVRFDIVEGLWFVASFNDDHNHELLGDKFTGLLRSHRRLLDTDVAQFNSMRECGISIPKIYGSFANQSGGFGAVGFRKKELYNQVQKMRKLEEGDAKSAFKYLRSLANIDPLMYWRYEVDSEGRLKQLFWCDGSSQLDYQVFGDVLAFDTTYGRNKYRCPLVVFSGVNHHKNTCVFGAAIVSDETECTYVWVLQKFLEAMKGKTPKSVITDGDKAMKNAIATVFPETHHRLCAWHLIRNATSNVGKPKFTQLLKRCMLGDYEVDEFEAKWEYLLHECDVTDNSWVQELYEKKMMWATAYIRGQFFAGLRTTSRCEALHSVIRKYIESRYSLTDFLPHFQRCLEYIRNNEVEADFKSCYGEPVMQTHLLALEKCASMIYTREVFYLFRAILLKSVVMKVVSFRETTTSIIYIVNKYCNADKMWHVSYFPHELQLKCSCQRMESFGLPCVHLIVVIIYMDIKSIPRRLVLDRWTKTVKEALEWSSGRRLVNSGDKSLYMSRYGALLHNCRQMCNLACYNEEDFHAIRKKVAIEISLLEEKHAQQFYSVDNNSSSKEGKIRNPPVMTQKGHQSVAPSVANKGKRVIHCSICKVAGHTRKSCPYASHIEEMLQSGEDASTSYMAEDRMNNEVYYTSEDSVYFETNWQSNFGEGHE